MSKEIRKSLGVKITCAVLALFFWGLATNVQASQKEPTPEDLKGATLIEADKEYTGGPLGEDAGRFYKIPISSGSQLKIFYHNLDNYNQPVDLRYFRADGKMITATNGFKDSFINYLPGNTADTNRYPDKMVYFQIYNSGRVFKISYSFKVVVETDKTDIGSIDDAPDKLENAISIMPGEYPNNFLAYNNYCGKYCSTDSADFYKISVEKGKMVEITITPDSGLEPQAQLFGADRTLLMTKQSVNPGQLLKLDYQQETAGDLFLAINCHGADCYGPYDFSVKISDAVVEAGSNTDSPTDNPNTNANIQEPTEQNNIDIVEPPIFTDPAFEAWTIKWFINQFLLWSILIGLVSFGLTIFWLVMLIDAVKREYPESNQKIIWLLVIIFVGWIGALIYYLVVKKKGNTPKMPTAPMSNSGVTQ
jgi:hypothetical protein